MAEYFPPQPEMNERDLARLEARLEELEARTRWLTRMVMAYFVILAGISITLINVLKN